MQERQTLNFIKQGCTDLSAGLCISCVDNISESWSGVNSHNEQQTQHLINRQGIFDILHTFLLYLFTQHFDGVFIMSTVERAVYFDV